MTRAKQFIRFLIEFVRAPGNTGAIAPSSKALTRRMVEWIDWSRVDAAVEFGPGSGAFTGEILSRLKKNARFFAIEINPEMVRILKERFPTLKVCQDSVENVRDLCTTAGIEQVDAVISGLPWASFSDPRQAAFLDAMMTVLRPGGSFATFAYLQGLLLPAGRRFRQRLDATFTEVQRSRVAWFNLPPAFVYRCVRL